MEQPDDNNRDAVKSSTLREAISERDPGATITLLVLRCEEPEETVVTLGEAEGRDGGYLGVTPWPPIHIDEFPFKPGMGEIEIERFDFRDGALVTKVIEDYPAEAAGVQEGDRILSVDGEEVTPEHSLPAIIRSK